MGTVSGTSARGVVVTTNATPPLTLAVSIAINSSRLPPQKRVGYFWAYIYAIAAPNQHYLIERGAVYAPGIYTDLYCKIAGSSFGLRLDVVFDNPGLTYTATII